MAGAHAHGSRRRRLQPLDGFEVHAVGGHLHQLDAIPSGSSIHALVVAVDGHLLRPREGHAVRRQLLDHRIDVIHGEAEMLSPDVLSRGRPVANGIGKQLEVLIVRREGR